jgi:hypothetical protein
VQLAERDGLEDEEVEGAGEEVCLFAHGGSSPSQLRRRIEGFP